MYKGFFVIRCVIMYIITMIIKYVSVYNIFINSYQELNISVYEATILLYNFLSKELNDYRVLSVYKSFITRYHTL